MAKKVEDSIDELHEKGKQKPRIYSKKVHKDYTSYFRNRKPGKTNAQAIGKQLSYLKRNIGSIEKMIVGGKNLSQKYIEKFRRIVK